MRDRQLKVLAAALETIEDALGIYDTDDCLIAFNSHYARVRSAIGGTVALGTNWDDLLLASIEAGTIPEALGHEDRWLAQRRRARGAYAVVRRLPDGTCYRVTETRMPTGGIAVVWTDITALVQPAPPPHDRAARIVEALRADAACGTISMTTSFDPRALAAKARWLRELATHADAAHRSTYLSIAEECDLLVGHLTEPAPLPG